MNKSAGQFQYFRGVALFFIIVAHAIMGADGFTLPGPLQVVFAILYISVIPGFFLVSGYNYKPASPIIFLKKRLPFVIKAYGITALLTIGFSALIHFAIYKNPAYLKSYIPTTTLVYGLGLYSKGEPFEVLGTTTYGISVIWFLLALFLGQLILNLVHKLKNQKIVLAVLIVLSILGYILQRLFILPYCLSYALWLALFMYVGSLLRTKKLLEQRPALWKYLIMIGLFFVSFVIETGLISLPVYACAILSLPGTLSGGYLLVRLFVFINGLNLPMARFYRWSGFYSLWVMCIHSIEVVAIPRYYFVGLFSNYALGFTVITIFRYILIYGLVYLFSKVKRHKFKVIK